MQFKIDLDIGKIAIAFAIIYCANQVYNAVTFVERTSVDAWCYTTGWCDDGLGTDESQEDSSIQTPETPAVIEHEESGAEEEVCYVWC